jgi:hypothetical protein
MSQTSNAQVLQIFKKVYGKLTDLVPQDFPLQRDIPWNEGMKVGEKFVEAICLTAETGLTLSDSTDAFEINPAIAGVVKQVEVTPYISVIPSIIPWGVISRSQGNEQAFFQATKHVVKNNLRSHSRFQEALRWWGRSPDLLGYISYASQVYRGVSFTTGTGTLPDTRFGSIAFTNGINAAGKYILVAPGQFASGLWIGMEGVKLHQVNSSGTVVASGKLVAVDTKYGVLKVDFTPVAASSTTSHRLCYDGQEGTGKDYYGIDYILRRSGTLFGVDNTQYTLWSGNHFPVGGFKLTLARIQEAIADAVNKGGLEGDLKLYVNPRTWATIATTEAGLRAYDDSYKPGEAENGFESITFHSQNGKIMVVKHSMMKEGFAAALHLPSWDRSGSAEVGFKVPGLDQDIIFPLQNQAGYGMRSYSDQYIFCREPALNIMFSGINDEAAS